MCENGNDLCKWEMSKHLSANFKCVDLKEFDIDINMIQICRLELKKFSVISRVRKC